MLRLIAIVVFLTVTRLNALEPNEIFLLVNKNSGASKEVADHYCQKRGVPKENIILLDVPMTEDISRVAYNERIVAPIRTALKDKKEQAKVLLSVYGIPLRVGGQDATPEEAEKIKALDPRMKEVAEAIPTLQTKVKLLEATYKEKPGDQLKTWLEETKAELTKMSLEKATLEQKRRLLAHAESNAAVDSELMMLWWDNYELTRWQLNLGYWRLPAAARTGKPPFVMTCRLDGPTIKIVKGLVDQAIEVEKKGLEGNVYVDARGIRYDPKAEDGSGYAGFDESMREMAALLDKEGKMKVILDDKPELFKPLTCPDCALYCGWYSLGQFIDSFTFVPGAIAWHLASSEAVSLRQPDAKYWCKCLLEKGVAVTLGPVAEPYTIGFPKPAEFFGFLATGKYTLVECYSKTILFSSWMTVLVGDPLYKPFAKNPKLKVEQVHQSPVNDSMRFNKSK